MSEQRKSSQLKKVRNPISPPLLPNWMERALYILAYCWLLLPSIQYFATVQRTQMLLEGNASYASLVTLDLFPLYCVLSALSALFILVRMFYVKRKIISYGKRQQEAGLS